MPIQLNLGIRPSDYCRFNNFYASERNRGSVSCLSEYADSIPSNQELVFVSGVSGSGVSHLLQALCHSITQRQKNCLYLPLSMFQEPPAVIMGGLLESISDLDLLVLDDLQEVQDDAEAQEALFHLYNRILNANVSLVCGAHVSPANLDINLPDLKSRLNSMLVCTIFPLTDTEKKAALEERAKLRGFQLPESVSNYLLKFGSRNMQDLMRYLEEADERSLAGKQKITLPLIKQVLNEASKETNDA